MRILIVNGHGNDEKSKLSFTEFQVQILKICSDQKELVDTEIECFYRDKNNLDDYLYDVQTGHIKKEYAYNFDHIDMIFICGNSNIRPWDIKMNKILTLIKMCSKSQKSLYVCGFGLYCLVYLYASNIEKEIKIINGDGNGGKLSEINDLQNKLYYIQPDEYFLDNTTGDLYGYSNQSDEWIPKGNVGIHNRKNAQEFQSFGKFVIKAPTYKANLRHLKQQLQYNSFKQRFYEDQCIIKKMYCQEKIFEDIQSEFLCPLISTWDVHTFLFTNPQKSFEVLAESNQRGPLIIRSKNILGSAFPVDSKYPETVQILKNYILLQLKEIKQFDRNQKKSIQNVTNDIYESTVIQQLKNQKKQQQQKFMQIFNKRAQSSGSFKRKNNEQIQKIQQSQKQKSKNQQEFETNQSQGIVSDEFRHVGFSAKKENLSQFYSQNNMSTKKIKFNNSIKIHNVEQKDLNDSVRQKSINQKEQQDNQRKIKLKFQDEYPSYDKNFRNNDSYNKDLRIPNFSPIKNQNSFQQNQFFSLNNTPRDQKQGVKSAFSNKNKQQNQHVFQINQNLNGKLYQNQLVENTVSSGNIRKILHPDISNEFISYKKLWVPGKMSQQPVNQQNKQHKMQIHSNIYNNSLQKKKLYSFKNDSLSQGMIKRPDQSGTLFSPMYNSFMFVGVPHKSQDQIQKEYQKKMDQQIIGPKSFKILNGNRESDKQILQVYKSQSEFFKGKSASLHNFREQDKNKWINQQNFKLI